MNFSWLDLFRALTLEATLAIGCAFAISIVVQSGFWRRSIWQACVLALGLLVGGESTGAARALIAWLATTHHPQPSEATEQSRRMAVTSTHISPENIWVNEEPTLAAASPATSVQQTWWPGVIWLTGFVLIGTRLGFAMLLFGRFRKQRRLVRDSGLLGRWHDLADRLQIRRTVRVSESESLVSPVAFGIFRACICVPADFARRFSPAQQSAMLAHEMAHVAGRDAVWYWLADVVTALFWWHPLVWFARRNLHASSEAAADEASLAIEDGPDLLAECLVQLGAQLQRPRNFALLGMSGFRSDLGRRVERLMRLPRGEWKPVPRVAGALARISALLALTGVALVCLGGIDPPTPGTTLQSAWTASLASVALTSTKEAIEDLKLSDALPNPLALPAAKARSTLRKPVLLANAQAAPAEDRQSPNPIPDRSTESVRVERDQSDLPQIGQGKGRTAVQHKLDTIMLPEVMFKPSLPSEAKPVFTRVFTVDPVAFIAGVRTAMGDPADLEESSSKDTTPRKNLYGAPLPGPVVDGPAAPADVIGRLANRPRFNGPSPSDVQINSLKSQHDLIRAFFAAAGVDFPKPDLSPPEQLSAPGTGKAVFFNDRTGLILVRATLEELDVIDKAIQVLNAPGSTENLVSRVFKVDPTALKPSLEKWARANPKLLSESDAAVNERESVFDRLKRYLAAAGVEFPGSKTRTETSPDVFGAFPVWPDEADPRGTGAAGERPARKAIFFKDRIGLIFVRANAEELGKIDKAIQGLHAPPRQVQIQVRFVELSDADRKALGLDRMLASAAASPERGAPPSELRQDASPSSPDVTRAIAAPARTALLNEPQVKVVRHAMEQRTGVDILTAPLITTTSGASVRIDLTAAKWIHTPEKMNSVPVGPSVNVIPLVEEDGRSIQLTVIANVTEFLGYDDPGPFNLNQLETRDLFDPPRPVPDRGPLPRFRQRQTRSSALVPNGQTLVLSGMTAEYFTVPPGQVPVLRDIPMIGRLFRSDASPARPLDKELFIFITPNIVDHSEE